MLISEGDLDIARGGMLRVLMLCLGLLLLPRSAQAGPLEDCNQFVELDRTIAGCTQSIARGTKGFNRPNLASLYNNRAVAYREKGDYVKSLADANESIRLNPDGINYRVRGSIFFRMGQDDNALSDYNHAIRLDPKQAVIYAYRGDLYARKGEDEKALADYTHAIRLDSKRTTAYLARGRYYMRKGDAERALADFNTAMKRDRADPEPLQERGAIYESKGLLDLAKADYSVEPREGSPRAAR
jgi:tetratricopeptide (TPR) repeat protein